jgi:DNA polymerase I-like protein with 3'-5' exonuclease and polymerase domains
MPAIATAELTPETIAQLSNHDRLQVYNGLDVCLTREVFDVISKQNNALPDIYNFERALQAPYLEIMLRGFRIDRIARDFAAAGLRERINLLQDRLDRFAYALWDRGLNPRSPTQLKDFFYGAMHLKEVMIGQKGEWKVSTNREALEKLEVYLHARPFINAILAIRDLSKQLQVFDTQIDADGRFRTSYNIAGTETGRPSSSENAFGTGGNAQNIAPNLRYVFVADEGYKLVNIDLEQVEARDVGFICGCLFDDWTYLDSCESGDLHTANARLIWPEINWTGDLKRDKLIAETPYYRDFTYRFMAKKGGHLSNYVGTAYTAARNLKVPQYLMEEFQAKYCRGRPADPLKNLPAIVPAYPAIPRYWQWVASELQTTHLLTNLFGRRRHFFGRPNDDATLREGVAFIPQSTTADRMNLGLWRVWKYMPEVELLAQTYDSITFQVHESKADVAIANALDLIRVELTAPSGRSYIVPGEAAVGWNWGYASETNPDGLVKWNPKKPDQRERTQPLQRIYQ